jgi:uncharacterized membrane protein YccC
VLEAVQQRKHDPIHNGRRVNALDRILERRRLDRDEQESHGPHELLHDLHARSGRALRRLDDEPGECDEACSLGMRDADHGHACVREPDRERAADSTGAEDGS